MNEQLMLKSIRDVLMRLEDTILFALIERAQFCCNRIIYEPGRFGDATRGDSLSGYLLHGTEAPHARMRRYTSPDEHPFYPDLPDPILPALRFDESPLKPNTININDDVRRLYENDIIPTICEPGDDQQYGSSSVCDVVCLQSLSRRVHYGKFVAESKYLADPGRLRPLIQRRDTDGLMAAITDPAVEAQVLERVGLKARTYGQSLDSASTAVKLAPGLAVRVYRDGIMPLNKKVQVQYLLERGE